MRLLLLAALACSGAAFRESRTLPQFEKDLMGLLEPGRTAPCIIRYAADSGMTQAIVLVWRTDGSGTPALVCVRLEPRPVVLPISQDLVPEARRIDLAAFRQSSGGDDVASEPVGTPLGKLLDGLSQAQRLLSLEKDDALRLVATGKGWRALLAGSDSKGQIAYEGGKEALSYACGRGRLADLVAMIDEEPAPAGPARFAVGDRGRAVHSTGTGKVRLRPNAAWKGLLSVLPTGKAGESEFDAAMLVPDPKIPASRLLPDGADAASLVERLVLASATKVPPYDPVVRLIRPKRP